MILQASLQWLRQSIHQCFNPQDSSHTLPWWTSYGIYFVRLWEKSDHVINGTALYSQYTFKSLPMSMKYVLSFVRPKSHYSDVIMSVMASQITSLTIVYSTVYSGADQRKHQSSASLAFVRGIHPWLVNSPHKRPVIQNMFPFDDAIMWSIFCFCHFRFTTIIFFTKWMLRRGSVI